MSWTFPGRVCVRCGGSGAAGFILYFAALGFRVVERLVFFLLELQVYNYRLLQPGWELIPIHIPIHLFAL